MDGNNVATTLKDHQNVLKELLKEFDRVCRELGIKYTLFSGTLLGAVRHRGFIPWDDDVDVIMLREDYDKFLESADKVLNKERFFLQKEFSEHFPMFFSKLRVNGTTCLEKYHPNDPLCHMGVYMDIFPCDNAGGTELERKIQFYASKVVIAKSLYKRGYIADSAKKKIFMNVCRFIPCKPFIKTVKKKKTTGKVHSFFAAASAFEKNIYEKEWFHKLQNMPFEDEEFPVSCYYDEILTLLYGDYMTESSESEKKDKIHAVLVDLDNSYEKHREAHMKMVFDGVSKSIR